MAFSTQGTVHRSTVTGRRGLVSSAHPLASLAGLRILMQGGECHRRCGGYGGGLKCRRALYVGPGGGWLYAYLQRPGEGA